MRIVPNINYFWRMAKHIDTGKMGEELAVKFLEAKGYTIFDRNYVYGKGEIDIVAFIPDILHFVEVKTRKNSDLNRPDLVLKSTKLKPMAKAGSFYIWERKLNKMPAVFDLLCIGLDDPENPVFRHFENAIHPDNPYF